jgi:hypothetical protein
MINNILYTQAEITIIFLSIMAFSIIATSILIHFTETKLFEQPSKLFLFIKSNKARTLMILSAPFYFSGWISAYLNGVPENPGTFFQIFEGMIGLVFLTSFLIWLTVKKNSKQLKLGEYE